MSYSFGGATIVDLEFTRSWGLSPASSRITVVGGYVIVVDGDVVLSLGGLSWYGVLSRIVDETQDGVRTTIEFVDNRVKLMRDEVYGLFNHVEIRSDNPSTPGIDRQKRYAHILPADWEKQIKTYTDEPMSGADIIQVLLEAPTVSIDWTADFHELQQNPVHEFDFQSGKKLGNALQEITEAQSLVFTLEGQYGLRWARKGEDPTPGFDFATAGQYSSGQAISAVDTQVAVIGDRNRYQDLSISLEPDWEDGYEDFWNEPDWLQEVADTFGPAGDDFASKAELAAKARKITVREYVAQKGDDFADYGMWGEVSRMEIPVWTYLQDIVFKAYRVPRGYLLNEIPLDSLELVEGLLCSVDYTLVGGLSYNPDSAHGGGYYPDAKAFVIAKGQQLSLLDPTKQRVISQAELARAGTEFAPNNRFNVDTRNKTIIFEDPVFVPNDLFIFPNEFTDAPDSLKGIAVPNAEASVDHAEVRASLVWDAEKYRKVFGSGDRRGPHYVGGLSKHKLLSGESDQGEVTYADNETADQKAENIAKSLIAQEAVYADGGYKTSGVYGTELNGSIDRVTTRLTFEGGISESVEFSKERPQSNFENERELERRQRAKDLFPGQRGLQEDVKRLELIAKVTKELKRSPLEPVYGSLGAIMEKPIGSPDCSLSKIYDPRGDPWDAGWPVFLGSDGRPSDSGEIFGGVVIADQSRNLIPCATQGIVPVAVQGPFQTDDSVGLNFANGDIPDPAPTTDGKRFIGRILSEGYSGNDTILAMVQLGASVSKDTNEYSFELVDASDQDGPKILVRDGEVDGHLPPGMGNNDFILELPNNDEVDSESSGENDIYLEITYDPDGTITSLSLNAVSPDDLPESTFGNLILKLGYALVHKDYDESGHPTYAVTEAHNVHCGDVHLDWPPIDKYAFQMFDATDEDGPKVIIMDGKVNGISSDDHVPSGMGGDDYILPVQDGWDIWLDIPYDPATFEIIDPVTIAAGDTIPTDTIGAEVAHSYIQIGYVDVETSEDEEIPQVIPHNSLCGDYYFQKPEDTNTYSFKMLDASDGETPKVRVLDGNVIDEDGEEHTPEGMGEDEFVREVADDDAIFMSIFYNRATRQIVEPITIGVGDIPDDTEGMTSVEIGYVNVDFDESGNAIVIPHNTLCGDFTFIIEDEPLYAFQMFDASETSPPGAPTYKVRVTDGNVIDRNGNEFTPVGMGADLFTAEVENDWNVYLKIPRDGEYNITDAVTVEAADETPQDDDNFAYADIGYVNIAIDGTLEIHNVQCGDYHFEPPPVTNRYAFELIDKSDNEGAKVLIMDGQVFGPNDDGNLPAGMGGDDYIIGVYDGAEIYLVITIDPDTDDVTSVTIGIGDATPEDAPGTKYVTIGYISVDSSVGIPVVNPTNALCGDYVLPFELAVTGQDDDGNDTNFDGVRQLNFLGAVTVHHDDEDLNENAIDVAIGPDLADDAGGSVDNPKRIIFTTEVSESANTILEEGPDEGEATVHIGLPWDISDDEGNEVDGVERLTVIRGDLPDPDDPDHLIVDAGDGEAELHIPTIDVVDDEDNGVNDLTKLQFTYGRPDDENLIIEDIGDGEALVHISKLDVIDTGDGDSIRLAAQLTFHHDRPNDPDTIVEAGDAGEARIFIPSLTVADDDGNNADNVDFIEFIGYADPVVDDDGEGGVVVQILPPPEIPADSDVGVLTTDGTDVYWGDGVDFESDAFYNAVADIIYSFVSDGGIDDLLTDGRLDSYIGFAIEDWLAANFDIEDYVEDVDVEVCVDGVPDTITLFGPLS